MGKIVKHALLIFPFRLSNSELPDQENFDKRFESQIAVALISLISVFRTPCVCLVEVLWCCTNDSRICRKVPLILMLKIIQVLCHIALIANNDLILLVLTVFLVNTFISFFVYSTPFFSILKFSSPIFFSITGFNRDTSSPNLPDSLVQCIGLNTEKSQCDNTQCL